MNPLKLQYFFAYGIMGCLMPFLSIYLEDVQGLSEGQIGFVLSLASFSILLTPVLMTLLADTRFDPRHLVTVIFTASGTALLALYLSKGFWLVLILLFIHSLAHAGVVPLHDGMTFSIQRQRELANQTTIPYYKIRVWGTIGFIVPSLILFLFLRSGWSIATILLCGLAYSLLAAAHAFRLPDPRLMPETMDHSKLPTTLAVSLLFQPHMRGFCLAMFLFYLASTSFGSFYPLYLVNTVGVSQEWVGLIFNFGVVIEIAFMLSMGWLQVRLGLRKIMILGATCFFIQMLVLGLFPTVWTAVLAQSFHGIIILALYISPIMYLNRLSEDRFRNSIQGVYMMLIVGVSRVIGISAAGQFAEINLRSLPLIAAGLALVSLLLLVFIFRDNEPPPTLRPEPSA